MSADRTGYLGPPIQASGGYWDQYTTGWEKAGGDVINRWDLPAHRGPEGIMTPRPVVEEPGFTAPGSQPDSQQPTGPPATATAGVDLSGLFAGNIMGIPTWVVVAVAAYFLFFKKR